MEFNTMLYFEAKNFDCYLYDSEFCLLKEFGLDIGLLAKVQEENGYQKAGGVMGRL